ncbi:MAG TPA: peptidoglycan-binding domain-containing protein [Magnetospirillum sp.]|nr:peptidoglycan-binding domain-containing protein [Magnetospirillum sp.]
MAVSLSACGMFGQEQSTPQTSAVPPGPANQQAASSDLVRDVQRGLVTRGYHVGPQDGVYGASTENALRHFQKDQNFAASGQIDARTLAALGVIGGASHVAYAPSGAYTQRTASSAKVRNVQQNLADRGYDPGHIDGRMGPRTSAALRDFQKDQNLQANGRPDVQTLAALGVETGSPATQTGQLPATRRSGTTNAPEQQQGQLPPSESERTPAAPADIPPTNPPQAAPANPQQ